MTELGNTVKNQIARLEVINLRTQVELVQEHIHKNEWELVRRVLRQAKTNADVLAKDYPNQELFRRVSYLISTVVDGQDIDIFNMLPELLEEIRRET